MQEFLWREDKYYYSLDTLFELLTITLMCFPGLLPKYGLAHTEQTPKDEEQGNK